MSITILEFAKSYVSGRLTAEVFCNSYIELWRIERENKILQDDEFRMGACLSSIFCVVDLYNPSPDREIYEFDNDHLHLEILRILKELEGGV